MKEQMRMEASGLLRLLEADEVTAGLYVRIYGKHLIMGREEPWGPEGEMVKDDRVRLTRLSSRTYRLSVRRHTGRWEKTPFVGSMEETVEIIQTLMQHLVASYP